VPSSSGFLISRPNFSSVVRSTLLHMTLQTLMAGEGRCDACGFLAPTAEHVPFQPGLHQLVGKFPCSLALHPRIWAMAPYKGRFGTAFLPNQTDPERSAQPPYVCPLGFAEQGSVAPKTNAFPSHFHWPHRQSWDCGHCQRRNDHTDVVKLGSLGTRSWLQPLQRNCRDYAGSGRGEPERPSYSMSWYIRARSSSSTVVSSIPGGRSQTN